MGLGIRNPKDFWAGLIYFTIGIAVVLMARNYPMGTAIKMGPAYFPSVLGGLLALIGLISLLQSFVRAGDKVAGLAWKELFLVLLPIVVFGIVARGAGLIAGLFVLIMVSASASAMFRWKSSLLLAIGMIAFCALIFVKALGVPLPLVGPWLGG
jgi:hypothetical protein